MNAGQLPPREWKVKDAIKWTSASGTDIVDIRIEQVVGNGKFYWSYGSNREYVNGPWAPSMGDLIRGNYWVERESNNPMKKFARKQCQ